MNIQPARLDQICRTDSGEMVLVTADIGGVADDLRRIDPGLKLRYSEREKYFAVYHESEDGRSTHLILTATECDQRIVKRMHEIDSHGRSGYDYGRELERASVRRQQQTKREFEERMGEVGEMAAHAVRRDLGERKQGRAFIPRDIPA